MKKYLLLFFMIYSSIVLSESRRTICATCIQSMEDSEEYVSRAGYGYAATLEDADSLAKRDAYFALLQVLRKSVKHICREAKIGNSGEEYYLAIKYLSKKETPENYYFKQDSILTNPPVLCNYSIQSKNGMFHACWVLAVSKKDLNVASNHILNEMLIKMVFDYL